MEIQFEIKGEKDLKIASKYLDNLSTDGTKVMGIIKKTGRTGYVARKKALTSYDKLRKALKRTSDNETVLIKNTKIASKASEELRYKFQGQWLSIMFFGMAIKRVFDNITKAGLTSFEQIMQGTDEFVRNLNPAYNSLNGLNASLDYLHFSVGQALGSTTSFNGSLARFNGWLGNIISRHPKFVAAIIRIGEAFAGLMAVLGVTELGLGGLTHEFTILGGASVIGAISKATSAVWGFVTALLSNPIALVIIAIAVAIGAVVWWLVKAKEKTGSWKEAFKQFAWGFVKLSVMMASVFYTVFTKAFNWIFLLLDDFVKGLNTAISAFNSLTGANISLIDTTMFDKLNKFTHQSWKDMFTSYYQGTMSVLGKALPWLKPKQTIVGGNWLNPNSWKFANTTQQKSGYGSSDFWNGKVEPISSYANNQGVKNQTVIGNVNINVSSNADDMYAYGSAIKQKMMDLVTTNGYTQTSG